MDNKTTFHFVGTLVHELPDMVINSQKMAEGNVISWVNASIKIADSIGGIIKLCLDKKNTKLLKNEVNNFNINEQKYQNQLEQEWLINKLSAIEDMKLNFEHQKKELSEKYNFEKNNEYSNKIKRKQEISSVMAEVRSNLKALIELYDNEILTMISTEEYSLKEKRHFEECKRLLIKQYNKNIDI